MVSISSDGPVVDFTPGVGAGTAWQTLAIFTPPNAHGGLLMVSDAGNYLSEIAVTTLDDSVSDTQAMAVGAYLRGWIVVSTGSTGFNINVVGGPGTDLAGGLWRDWDDATYLNDVSVSWNERDAVWARQYLGALDKAGGFSVQISHWSWYGVSQGAINGAFMSLGPSRALPGAAEIQRRESTHIQSQFIMDPGAAWWLAFQQTIPGSHWPIGGVGVIAATTISQADQGELERSSMIGFMNEAVAVNPAHSFPPMYVGCDESHESSNFSFGVSDRPSLYNAFGLVPVHPAWGGQMLAKRYARQHSQLAFQNYSRFILDETTKQQIVFAANDEDESNDTLIPLLLYSGTLSDRLAWLDRQFAGQKNPDAPASPGSGIGTVANSVGSIKHITGAVPAQS